MSASHDPHRPQDLDLDEACRLLDGAMDMLSRMAEDPRSMRERAASSLIDEMRAWGKSTAAGVGGRKSGSR